MLLVEVVDMVVVQVLLMDTEMEEMGDELILLRERME